MKQVIEIMVGTEDHPMKVRIGSHTYGHWAAHVDYRDKLADVDDPCWVVTHIPTGRTIKKLTGPATKARAIRIAREFSRRFNYRDAAVVRRHAAKIKQTVARLAA